MRGCFLVPLLVGVALGQSVCPGSERCMQEGRLRCDPSNPHGDYHCCAGLQCVPVYIPPSGAAGAFNSTQCVPPGNPALADKPVQTNWTYLPFIMANAFQATTTYYNMSNGGTGTGAFYYDNSQLALRIDFGPMCPFLQLQQLGIESNYVPCSVLFYEGWNYYIYPSHGVCCKYHFPLWQPNWMCESNSTYAGSPTINGVVSDWWQNEWYTDYPGVYPLRNIRDMYTVRGTGVPLRFMEDLDSGWLDFHNYKEGPVDSSVFMSIINQYPCHFGYDPPRTTDETCTHYNSQNVRETWPTGFCPSTGCNPPRN